VSCQPSTVASIQMPSYINTGLCSVITCSRRQQLYPRHRAVRCAAKDGHGQAPGIGALTGVLAAAHPADAFCRLYGLLTRCSRPVLVFVRHGNSTWNEQSRIQGNTNLSELTDAGRTQAVGLPVPALQEMTFDR